MIVDDDKDILTTLKIFYEHHGIEVFTLTNGKDCIKHLEKGFRGILLIDLMMPGLDGWETIKEIVRRGYDSFVSINIITGIGSKDHEKIAAFAPYISDYISKPFDEHILRSLIDKAE
jgi:DNA-binding response OmpR family regulator